MRAGPRTASTSLSPAAMIMCPCGGRIDSRPCVEITRACTPLSATAPARLFLTRSGRSRPLPFSSVKGVSLEEAGEVVYGLEVVVQADPLVRRVEPAPRVRHATCHDGRYSEVGNQERGRPTPPDGRIHDNLVFAQILPRLYSGADDGRVHGRLRRLDAMQVDHLDILEAALPEVGPDQLHYRTGALAGDEPEVHLHERLRWYDGLGAWIGVACLYARDVRGRAQQHFPQRVLAGKFPVERFHTPGLPQRMVVEEDAVYGFQVLLRGFFGEVVEAVQCDLTVFVLDGPQGLDEAPDGVRGYAAVHAVQVVGGAAGAQFHVGHPFGAAEDHGPPRLVFHGTLPETGVGGEEVCVGADEGRQVGAADLFLALDEELEPEGQWAMLLCI